MASESESGQVIGESLKELYMACSEVPPHSAAQQKLVVRMAEKASNGKELLLVMRAAIGVFPAGADKQEKGTERRVLSLVAAKMMKIATLNQLIEYARQYSVNPEDARPFVQRMIQLADRNPDPAIWYRIKLVATDLNIDDLQQQAQTRGDQLTGR